MYCDRCVSEKEAEVEVECWMGHTHHQCKECAVWTEAERLEEIAYEQAGRHQAEREDRTE